MSKIVCIFCGFLALTCSLVMEAAADQVSADSVYAVWSTAAANRTADIWYARRFGENWNEPTRLEIGKGLHVTPVIAADSEGTIWFVWIEQTADASLLRYARVRDGKIIETGRVLAGDREQSYAPAIVLDTHDQPWIAWSGIVDRFADIFASRWTNNAWTRAAQVNPPNRVPDITPIMGRKDKTVWVSWFGFDTTDRYVQFLAKWADTTWSVDKKVLPSINIGSFIRDRTATEIILPQQAAQRMMGAVFSGSRNEIQSVTERFRTFKVEKEK